MYKMDTNVSKIQNILFVFHINIVRINVSESVCAPIKIVMKLFDTENTAL